MSKFKMEVNSNVLQKGKRLDISIKVFKEDDNGQVVNFKLKESKKAVVIENIDAIADFGKGQVQFYLGKKNTRISGSGGVYSLYVRKSRSIPFFEIKIMTVESYDKDILDTIPIKISFNDNDSAEELEVNFIQKETPIELINFKAAKSIVQKNVGGNKTEFSFELKGNADELMLLGGNDYKRELVHTNGKYTSEIDFTDKNVNQMYTYTLRLSKNDGQQVSRSINVVYLDESRMGKRLFSQYSNEQESDRKYDLDLINICGSKDSKILIALFYHKEVGFKIGYTPEIDGDNWQYVDLNDTEDAIKYFANSPMLHFSSKDDHSLGSIIFTIDLVVKINMVKRKTRFGLLKMVLPGNNCY